MYAAVLNTQRGVLQEDSGKLRRELHHSKNIFHIKKLLYVILPEITLNERLFTQSPVVFLGPCQTSMMERIMNDFWKNNERVLAVNNYRKESFIIDDWQGPQ